VDALPLEALMQHLRHVLLDSAGMEVTFYVSLTVPGQHWWLAAVVRPGWGAATPAMAYNGIYFYDADRPGARAQLAPDTYAGRNLPPGLRERGGGSIVAVTPQESGLVVRAGWTALAEAVPRVARLGAQSNECGTLAAAAAVALTGDILAAVGTRAAADAAMRLEASLPLASLLGERVFDAATFRKDLAMWYLLQDLCPHGGTMRWPLRASGTGVAWPPRTDWIDLT
jgi:hypothetical protein